MKKDGEHFGILHITAILPSDSISMTTRSFGGTIYNLSPMKESRTGLIKAIQRFWVLRYSYGISGPSLAID